MFLLNHLWLHQTLQEANETPVSGTWRKYAAAVFPDETNAAILWSEEQIEELQFEKTAEEIKALKNRVDDQIKEYAEEGGEYDPEDLRWALSIVRSRSFVVDLDEDGKKRLRALLPVADLFNHQPESPVAWALAEAEGQDLDNPWRVIEGDDEDQYFEVLAHRSWKQSEEVLLPYGLETGSELLTSHGLVLEENEAEYLPLYMVHQCAHPTTLYWKRITCSLFATLSGCCGVDRRHIGT